VRSGSIQQTIAETRDNRIDGVRQGRIEIVGTNVFPNEAEPGLQPPSMTPTMAPGSGAAETVEALRFVRPAEPFEMLRTRSEAPGGPPLDAAGGASRP